jgi:hypothetical protein
MPVVAHGGKSERAFRTLVALMAAEHSPVGPSLADQTRAGASARRARVSAYFSDTSSTLNVVDRE